MSQSLLDLDSYPPLFRQTNPNNINFSQDEIEIIPKQAHNQELDDPLPVIDLHSINLDKLSLACTDWGIFRLVNHGIPLTLLDKLHEHTAKIFSLGFEAKQGLFSKDSIPLTYFWGTPALTPSGVALQLQRAGSDQQAQQDVTWVEGLYVPLGQPPKAAQLEDQDEDPLLHSFRLLLEDYGNHQSRLARTIFEAMAENLNLGPTQTESYLSPSTGYLRVYRYPRCAVEKQAWGIDVHTDSSVLTILNQDEVGGLQLYKDNLWIDAKPIPNTLIVHLGDMMQAMSDDKYKSVQHRVKVHRHMERISMGYFVFPAEDCVIESSLYKPFTYPDFRAQVQHDLKTIGFKVGLQRFKINETS